MGVEGHMLCELPRAGTSACAAVHVYGVLEYEEGQNYPSNAAEAKLSLEEHVFFKLGKLSSHGTDRLLRH